jgi:hypothetical protein
LLRDGVTTVPRVSQFFGIIITMYYNDHNPPHFHATYGDDELLLSIMTFETVAGRIPRHAQAMVLEWAALHRAELLMNWEKARKGLPIDPILPLE